MAQEYARIFAALDGASTQEEVAQRAISLAADNHAKLMFGHVIDSVPYEASGVDFEALCAEGQKRLESELAAVPISIYDLRSKGCDAIASLVDEMLARGVL